MADTDNRSLDERFEDDQMILDAINRAVRAALLRHKHAGNPIAIWRDGRVVHIAPEDIQVDQET